MGPSNLNQVFVVNNVSMLTGSNFNTSAATANASRFGIWNIDAGITSINLANASTTSLGTTVTVTSTAGLVAGMTVVKTAGAGVIPGGTTVSSITNATQFVLSAAPTTDLSGAALTATAAVSGGSYTVAGLTDLRRVQFTQSTLGNIISTPIIDVANIVRINYNGFASDVQQHPIQTWNPAGGTAMVTNKNVMLRIALRTAPTSYESFANPNNLNLDVIGTTGLPNVPKVFPLVGNFAAGRMIFNIEIPAGVNTANATAACDFAKAAILASPTLNSIFSYNATSSATLALTARHQGVEFDLVAQYSDGTATPPGTVAATRFTPGTNYTQAISAEKSQRARYGNFNRMYFATPQVDYAQPGYAYDMLEIQYKHDWPASTGIARAGEINTLKVFFGSSSTALSAAADFATAFGIAIATDEEQATDVVLQPNV